LRFILSILFLLSIVSFAEGQIFDRRWYSEMDYNGLIIQNSYPKGGRYAGPIEKHFNYSNLVFYTRIINETEDPVNIYMNFSADSIPIPNSPHTFVKLFLPSDTMSFAKESLFNYGFTEMESFENATCFYRKVYPGEDCLFYVVSIFYQTDSEAWNQERGGNRGELVLQGQDLFYSMPPQIDFMHCGSLTYE